MAENATKLPIKTEKAGAGAPTQWTPFDTLRREIDRVFDSFGWPLGNRRSLIDVDFDWPKDMGFAVTPAVDIAERDGDYEITAELPGLDQKDIDIKLANGVLTIKGEKQADREERKKDYYVSERRYGQFVRSFQLPDGVDLDKVEARFAKGVLTVTLPKTAEARSSEKKIEVKAA